MRAFAAAFLMLCLACTPALADHIIKEKVVYHINQNGGEANTYYFAALGNIRNHLGAVGAGKIQIKVVMHGNGLGLVKNAKEDTRLQSVIAGLKGDLVEFVVCKNTMTQRNIAREDLYDVDAEDIVQSGVAELTHLQHHGFTYVKP